MKKMCELFKERVSRGIDFGRLNLLGSICGELLSKPGFNEAGEQLYNRVSREFSECMKENKAPTDAVLSSAIDEYLEVCKDSSNRDKWCEYSRYFKTEVKADE